MLNQLLQLSVAGVAQGCVYALVARGRVEKRGRDICYLSAELAQDGRTPAKATAAAIVRKTG